MLILQGRKFIEASFDSEAELEQVVIENAENIFGPGTIFLEKALIKTIDGSGTVPDGFVIDLATRQWFIIEAELRKHSVWSHIAPQIAKQVIASNTAETKQRLIDLTVGWEEGGLTRVYLHPGEEAVTEIWPSTKIGATRSAEDATFADINRDDILDVVSSCEGNEQAL